MLQAPTGELFWMALTAAWTAILFAPYAVVRIKKIGWGRVMIDPLPGDDPFEKAWAHRAYRAHMNAIETFATFAPVAIAVSLSGASTETTVMAAQIYFWSRLIHAPIYIFKVPVLRLLTFMVGLACTLILAWALVI